MNGWRRDAVGGLLSGLGLLGVVELAGTLGVPTLPDVIQDRLLALTPGPVFGFLIDSLQHAGKVLEEAGLLAAMLVALVLLAIATGAVRRRMEGVGPEGPPGGVGPAQAAAASPGSGPSDAGTAAPGPGTAVAEVRGDGGRRLPVPAGWLAAGLVWLVVCLVVYPLAGKGLLGLGAAWGEPLAWLVAAGAYGLLLEMAARPATADEAGRRRLVWWAGGVGLAAIAITRVPGWFQYAATRPSSVGRKTPAVTPVGDFYVVSKNFQDPTVSANGWSLHVGGMAQHPFSLSYDQLKALPATTRTVTLECISNPVGGNLMSTGHFTGVPLRELLRRAGPGQGAGALAFRARDGYTESMDLPLAMADPDILVAHTLDGGPLPDNHGFPARVLVPGRYGMRGPKWLEEITFTRAEQGGYWEAQGWDPHVDIATTSRIDVPIADTSLTHGAEHELAGVAFGGVRGVKAVQWSSDGGRTWHDATLAPPLSPLTWVLWTARWRPAAAGSYVLTVRAQDGSGRWQDDVRRDSFPRGATGYHTVSLQVR
jgi:DMSO/TMAO reductase YedYZ molybdopterin-dependent catalytic subunit